MSEAGRSARSGVVLPLIPLREMVVFPTLVTPLYVGRTGSVEALEKALEGDRELMVVCQKDPSEDEPQPDGLHEIGTVVRVHQVARLPDGILKTMVEGLFRARLVDCPDAPSVYTAKVDEIDVKYKKLLAINTRLHGEMKKMIAMCDYMGEAVEKLGLHLTFDEIHNIL